MGQIKTNAYTPLQTELGELFRALGHPARIAILQKLLEVGCCISRDFTDDLDLAQPTISRHVKELKAARLIEGVAVGNRTEYRISPARWPEIQRLLHTVAAACSSVGCSLESPD